jgi:hypothetical protein
LAIFGRFWRFWRKRFSRENVPEMTEQKIENGRHHRRLSGAARHARGDSNARDG